MIKLFIDFSSNDFFNQLFGSSEVLSTLATNWILVFIVTVALCFFVGEITRNLSQVDKVWSIMPIVYSAYTLSAFPTSARVWMMSGLVTFWGLRLSYNFYRKGGYHIIPWKGEEDYRWAVLRETPVLKDKWRVTLFNLIFISFYQQLLILLFSSPLLLAAQHAETALTTTDIFAAIFMFAFIMIETLADNQLFSFHLQKKQKVPHDGRFPDSLKNGFMTEGLWKYVRHPNFAAEQSIWVSFYFFGVAASGQWINWTISGPVLLILLFLGSSEFTESISKKKYPAYQQYKSKLPRFIPIRLRNRE